MDVTIKEPGPGGMRFADVPLDMTFAEALAPEAEEVPDAYERLIMDVIQAIKRCSCAGMKWRRLGNGPIRSLKIGKSAMMCPNPMKWQFRPRRCADADAS